MSDTLHALHEAHKARRQRFFAPPKQYFPPPIKIPEPEIVVAPPMVTIKPVILVLRPSLMPTRDLIVKVARFYKVPVKELIGPRRTKDIARSRQVAMFLAREILRRSYPEIGRRMGGRDHSTVIHGCERITRLMEIDGDIRNDIEQLRKALTQ